MMLTLPLPSLAVLLDFDGVIVDPPQEDAASLVRIQQYVSRQAALRPMSNSRTSSARCSAQHIGARQHAQ
jgi:hypothetical protein